MKYVILYDMSEIVGIGDTYEDAVINAYHYNDIDDNYLNESTEIPFDDLESMSMAEKYAMYSDLLSSDFFVTVIKIDNRSEPYFKHCMSNPGCYVDLENDFKNNGGIYYLQK